MIQFTKEDLSQIESYLKRKGIKDSEFADFIPPENGSEYVIMIQKQNGVYKNVKCNLSTFKDLVGGIIVACPEPTIVVDINGICNIYAYVGATNCDIVYTLDGSTPSFDSESSSVYNGPFEVSESCTIQAIARYRGLVSSIITKEYEKPISVVTPIIEVDTDPYSSTNGVVTITVDSNTNTVSYYTINNGEKTIISGSSPTVLNNCLYNDKIVVGTYPIGKPGQVITAEAEVILKDFRYITTPSFKLNPRTINAEVPTGTIKVKIGSNVVTLAEYNATPTIKYKQEAIVYVEYRSAKLLETKITYAPIIGSQIGLKDYYFDNNGVLHCTIINSIGSIKITYKNIDYYSFSDFENVDVENNTSAFLNLIIDDNEIYVTPLEVKYTHKEIVPNYYYGYDSSSNILSRINTSSKDVLLANLSAANVFKNIAPVTITSELKLLVVCDSNYTISLGQITQQGSPISGAKWTAERSTSVKGYTLYMFTTLGTYDGFNLIYTKK